MINYNLYKLLNPDLKNLNNTQLLFHWKNKGMKEKRIYSLESFFKVYPNFKLYSYKDNYPNIIFKDNFDIMAHWHLIGRFCSNECKKEEEKIIMKYELLPIKKEQKIFTNTYIIISNNIIEIDKKIEWIFNYGEDDWNIIIILNGIKYNNNLFHSIENKISIINNYLLPIEKLYLVKDYILNSINTYYYTFSDSLSIKKSKFLLPIEKKDLIEYPINIQYPIIGIYICENNIKPTKNFYIKSLSKINYHEMNIIQFKDSNIDLKNIFKDDIDYFILNYIDIQLDTFIYNCDYLITNNLELNLNYNHITTIFYPNSSSPIYLPNLIIIDDILNENYFENSLLITKFDTYLLENNLLFKTNNYSTNYSTNYITNYSNNFSNKIYINDNLIKNFEYDISLKKNDIKIIYTKYIDCNYGIVKNKEEYYIKFYNKYYLTNLEFIINNLPLKVDSIYIQENNNINIVNIGYLLNFKIYLIYNINEENEYIISNISYFLNNKYNNFKIIIYFSNFHNTNAYFENLKKLDKIEIFYSKDSIIKSDKDILLELESTLEENSLIFTFKNNNYIIEQNILLENINILFIAKKLQFYESDLYSIKKKEFFISENIDICYDFYLNNIISNSYIQNSNFENIFITFIHYNTDLDNWIKNINSLENENIHIIEINTNSTKIDFEKNLEKKFNYIYLNSENLDETYKLNRVFAYNLYIKYLKKNNIDYKYIKLEYFDINENNNDIINDFKNINKTDEEKIIFQYQFKNSVIDLTLWNKIKSFVINLDERTDRLYNTWKECNKIDLYNIERFSAIKIIDQTEYKLIDNNKAWKKNNIDYLKSASGCKLSHLEVLKKYKECNEEYLMIIEDDVIFDQNTFIYLNLALNNLSNIDWNILYLSTNLKEQEDAIKVNSNLLQIKNGLTTTAQLFKRSNIDKIIKLIEESDIEIDNTYNLLDNKYSVYPMCVYQSNSYSDINKKNMDYGMFHRKFNY